MTKQSFFAIAAILLCAVVLQAQQPDNAPFAVIDKEVRNAPQRWAGDKESLSKIFDDERKRLGAQFESELMRWLGNDATKHYWVSAFIDCESYLHGNKRLPELSLLIKAQGLELVRGKSDDESIGYVVGFSVTAATLSAELGLEALAISHKRAAQALLQVNRYWAEMFPRCRRRSGNVTMRSIRQPFLKIPKLWLTVPGTRTRSSVEC